MKLFIVTLLTFMLTSSFLFDFDKNSSMKDWRVVDDVVMGGRSDGSFVLNEEGNAEFKGKVSLENNGGFSSVRYQRDAMEVKSFEKVVLRIKGDGKRYQFRIKTAAPDSYSYIHYFETSGQWESVELSLEEFYPTYRGRTLDQPNYDGKQLEEVAFLIANGKAEGFQLEIDHIAFK
jgi:hypothetical protein